ncbi:MAG TPA: sulfotransferase, partial [Rubellimicrobium sp.]|nr:sulfotransferase [Rubellimicrobium sp.]
MEREQQQVRQALVVLGMHRSGTSALSGALHHMGATMPRTPMPGTPNNPFGHFESLKVWELNEAILEATGSSWDDCLRFDADWLASSPGREMGLRAQAVLAEEYGSEAIVLLKDPRICRFFVFWRTALEQAGFDPVVVHIHRDPLEVAASLTRRNGLSTTLGLLLWLRHVLDAEEQSRGLPRVFVDYASLLGDWAGTIGKISATLHLDWPTSSDQVRDAMSEFLRPELRHFDGSSAG